MKKSNTSKAIRRTVQIIALLLSLGFLALIIRGGQYVIHQACPYAAVCFGLNGGSFLRLGTLVMSGAIIFGFAVLVFSMFYGRLFCAWLCPYGTMQELVFLLRGRKYRMKHRSPYHVDRRLAFVKYLILLITVALSGLGLAYIFIRLCPFYGLSLLPKMIAPGVLITILVIVASLFWERVWCRFICPYAALMNAFQWLGDIIGIRRKKIRRNLERCTNCGLCSLNCPMNINLEEYEYVHDRNCIHCGRCIESCPKPGTCAEERECEE